MSDAPAARPSRRAMSARNVALRSGAIFDIPPRTRTLLLLGGLVGVVVIVAGTLVASRNGSLPLDKLLHFAGYTTLAALFTLALRPRHYLPALAGLAALGLALEFLQRLSGRQFELRDEVANVAGVAVGAALGLLVRSGYGWVRGELATLQVRRRLIGFDPGEVILHEGAAVADFCIVKQGTVRLTRRRGDGEVDLGTAGAGDAIGILAVVQGTPQYATARAETPVVVYRMGLDQLFDAAGGSEQPVAVMLRSMAAKLREAGDRLTPSAAP